MFIKRKTRAGKTYDTYRMFLSFKILATYKKRFNFTSDITRFFAGQCPMPGANIQACIQTSELLIRGNEIIKF